MQTTDGDWKDSCQLRDSTADDITVPETPGLHPVENLATSNLKYPDTRNTDSNANAPTQARPVADDGTVNGVTFGIGAPTSDKESLPSDDKSVAIATPLAVEDGSGVQRQRSRDVATFESCSNGESEDVVVPSGSPPVEAEVKSQSQESTADTKPEMREPEIKRPFDCNVCFDLATDPVVTRCGHLYCWPCLHAWLKQARECPVCKAQVTKETVVPIYGQGSDAVDPRSKAPAESDIPERPRPERVEATRRRPHQPNQAAWNLSMFAGTSLSFGIFPIGVGVTWPGTWGAPTSVATSEEIFSQLLSLAFLFVAIFVTLGIVFVGDHSPEF